MKNLLFLTSVAILSFSAFAVVPQFGINGIGDFSLVTLGKYTFSTPVSIELMPTNAPSTNGTYAVRCQVIYVDGDLQSPSNEDDLEALRQTGDWLIDQLKVFIADNYRGAEFDDLVRRYYEGAIGSDLDQQFPLFVTERMQEAGLDVEVVKVQVSAEGDLRTELISFHKAQKALAQLDQQ